MIEDELDRDGGEEDLGDRVCGTVDLMSAAA
jgi:hypothetical protein